MIILETNGKEYTLPSHVSEITLSQYIDFQEHEMKFVKENQFSCLLDAVNCIVIEDVSDLQIKGDSDDVMEDVSVISIYLYLINLLNDYLEDILNQAKEVLILSEDDQAKEYVKRIDNANHHIQKMNIAMELSNYGFGADGVMYYEDLLSFNYKGDDYSVSKKFVGDILVGNEISAGEFAVINEYRRNLSEREVDNDIPEQGMLMYKLRLHDVAVLCRKKDEVLPSTKKDLQAFINSRMLHFQELPMDVAYNVCFFLTSTYAMLLQKEHLQGFMEDMNHLMSSSLAMKQK